MNPRLRLILGGSIGIFIGIVGAQNIANESYGFVGLIGFCSFWIIAEWRDGARPESMVFAAILFGYIVGNRGFAQFQFAPRIPLLPAEAALIVCTATLGFRAALSRASLIVFDAVNISILVWIAYATTRLPLDMNTYGVMALRDYALVYYASFFFLCQFLGRELASVRLLDGALTAAFLALPLVVITNKILPDFFLQHFNWNGIPLIFHKSDLTSESLVCGSFWLWSRFERDGRFFWLLPSAISILLVGAEESPRAALVAATVTAMAWFGARRFKLIGFQIAVVAAGIAVSIPVEVIAGRTLTETRSYAIYERVVSMIDLGGSHAYRNAESASTIDNNNFRRVWWKAVYEETIDFSPFFGLGFGHDLAAHFLADYNWLSVQEEFNTRSPHSVIVTVFGRLGSIGLSLFLIVGATIARSGYRAFQKSDVECMAWWSIVITIGVSACFGVVLEGPMGAVPFWVALGIAHYKTNLAEAAKSKPH